MEFHQEKCLLPCARSKVDISCSANFFGSRQKERLEAEAEELEPEREGKRNSRKSMLWKTKNFSFRPSLAFSTASVFYGFSFTFLTRFSYLFHIFLLLMCHKTNDGKYDKTDEEWSTWIDETNANCLTANSFNNLIHQLHHFNLLVNVVMEDIVTSKSYQWTQC